MQAITINSERQISRSIGIVDLSKVDGNLSVGELVLLNYPNAEQIEGRCVRVDEEANEAYIQNYGLYTWAPRNPA